MVSTRSIDNLKKTPDENRKVIFLDIDGVLNDDGERREDGELSYEAIEILNGI